MVANDFTLPDQNGQIHTLVQYKGHWVILYFYPRDDTPGCTKEACSIRDGQTALKDAGITVLGISVDTLESHQKFSTEHQLNFPLLADDKKIVTKAYGCDAFYGLAKRHTFIIKPDQTIGVVLIDVDVSKHSQQILEAVKKLKDNPK